MTSVSQPPPDGGTTAIPALLATAYETLDHIATVLYEHAGRAGHMIAPFMVAAAAAADGRDAVVAAPSLPAAAGHSRSRHQRALGESSPEDIADSLAEAARVLSADLAGSAGTARDPRDRAALATASRCAETIHSCLAGTG